MIAFVSLFLGLAYGPEMVEVTVGDPVVRVELRLDGETLAVIDEPPWKKRCDLGSEIAPRLLEAVAFDGENRELGRASQWLNLPQPRAVANVVLEPKEPGQPRVARLSWESVAGAEPESISATLDGEPIRIDDPARFELPPVDESQFHLLHIDLRFEGRVRSRVDVTFGGSYVDEVSTEITAVPLVSLHKGRRPPSKAEAAEWFLKDGETLPVLAIEREQAEVVVVMDRPFPRVVAPGERYKPPKSLFLPGDLKLRFLSTFPREKQGVATSFELFPISPAYGGDVGDLYRLLTGMSRPAEELPPRPAAAVAVAGLAAYEGRRRRAVVLIPSLKERDAERLDEALVKRYLGRLGVPLFVWNPRVSVAPELKAWGDVLPASDLKQLAKAFDAVVAALDRQWIVWIDGRHLPQEIQLAPGAEGFALLPR